MLKKIVVIGPESTGKSTLCSQLAQHFNTIWCPEYAREYLLKNGTDYTYNQLLEIATGQARLEDETIDAATQLHAAALAQGKNVPVIIDTDMHVMQVWCNFVFGKVHPFVTEQLQQRQYHLYLLCNTDLPWVKDELREYPDLETRQELFNIYKNLLENQPVPWQLISGTYDHRFNTAVDAVNKILAQS